MIALILNDKGTVIESMVMANAINVKSFFYNNPEADSAIFIDREDHLDGDAVISDSTIAVGTYSDEFTNTVLEGLFDLERYELIPVPDIEDPKVIGNLIHVYNGGKLEEVPFPMPYRREYMTVVNTFNEKEVINEFTRYSKDQVLNF